MHWGERASDMKDCDHDSWWSVCDSNGFSSALSSHRTDRQHVIDKFLMFCQSVAFIHSAYSRSAAILTCWQWVILDRLSFLIQLPLKYFTQWVVLLGIPCFWRHESIGYGSYGSPCFVVVLHYTRLSLVNWILQCQCTKRVHGFICQRAACATYDISVLHVQVVICRQLLYSNKCSLMWLI